MAGSYNQTYTFWDLARGLFGRGRGLDGTAGRNGFIFVEQSGQTRSGEQVHVDNLLDEATTMSCINAIVQGITQIPVYVCRYNDDGTKEILRNHPVQRLMKRPNDFQTPTEFKSSIVTAILTHGNCYIKIVKASGRAKQLYPLDPSDITIGANALGRPVYTHEEFGDIETDEIIHIRDLNTYTPQGLSRALLAAEIIGAKKAADKLIAESFRDGLSIQYAVTSDAPINDAAKLEALQEQMQMAFGREGRRRGGAAFIEQGSIQKIDGLNPADIDLRELREMLIREIAAVFRVPPFMVGASGDQTYNNVRQYWASFHRDTLQPIVTNIEEAITLKLLSGEEHLFFDTGELLKGDVEVTARIAQQNVSNGIWTPNEGRLYVGTQPHDSEEANQLVTPNTSTNYNPTDDPGAATGGPDGPQGRENEEDSND